jgi:hypothetical protein
VKNLGQPTNHLVFVIVKRGCSFCTQYAIILFPLAEFGSHRFLAISQHCASSIESGLGHHLVISLVADHVWMGGLVGGWNSIWLICSWTGG